MAIDICKLIASNSPVAVAVTKSSLNYSRDHSVQEGLEHIASANSMALLMDNLVVSFTAVGSKNDPSFANL
jgi:delta(3,5)-delta(2,4)-dienoyl-CoA isomerase